MRMKAKPQAITMCCAAMFKIKIVVSRFKWFKML
jgi:hypothetical protein